jgi:signal transduction histidine kinase
LIALAEPDVPSVHTTRAYDVILAVSLLGYSAVGTLIATRRPANRVGWLFLASGLFLQVWVLSLRYAALGAVDGAEPLPGAVVAAWLGAWTLVPGIGLAFSVLPLVFPDGHLVSRAFRPIAWFSAGAIVFAAGTWALEPGQVVGTVENPYASDAVGALGLAGLGWLLLMASILASFVTLAVRYRRSTSSGRRQIRWLVGAAATMVLTFVLVTIGSEADWAGARALAALLFPLAVLALPSAAALAVLKEDLYDLDPVVSRSISFGLLVSLITVVYLAVVVGIGSMVGTAADANVVLSVIATAVVALAFQPVRARVQRLANRLVYGRRAAPYELLAAFAHRMGEAPDASEVLPELAQALCEATGATRVDVWLVVSGDLARVASSAAAFDRTAVALQAGRAPSVLPDATQAVEVRRSGALVGVLALALPDGRELGGLEQKLVVDLAAQAALVLSNLRLVEELKASRQRIVSAHDDERRRLERDIHDGVQQHLVALALDLQMLGERMGRDSDEVVAAGLADASAEAREAMGELRRLARGIHPAAVTESGLAGALESLVDRTPIPVRMTTSAVRLATTIEVTIYYLVAEALTNAVKHAAASEVTIDLAASEGRVHVEIADDGIGGAAAANGSGLSGLADRVSALDGELRIDSVPGRGTRIHAAIPCASS